MAGVPNRSRSYGKVIHQKRAETGQDSPSCKANLESLSLSCAGWSSAPPSSHTPEPTVTQPQALEKQTCTFGTPMYFRRRFRSHIFLCTERLKRPPVHPSQLLSSCQAGQQKARRGFWHGCDAHGPTPTGSPIPALQCLPRPHWHNSLVTGTSPQPGPGHQLHLKSWLR